MLLDPDDPLSAAIRRLKWTVQRILLVSFLLLFIALTLGCPHFQTSYQYRDMGRGYIPANERELTSANYLGPFGWMQFHAVDSGRTLPVIKFVPLNECINFER